MNNISQITDKLKVTIKVETVENLAGKILAQTARILAQSALSMLVQAIELLVTAKRNKEAEELLAACRNIKFTTATL